MANILVKATNLVNFQNVDIQQEMRVVLVFHLSREPAKSGC
jgi:hypothetical protein